MPEPNLTFSGSEAPTSGAAKAAAISAGALALALTLSVLGVEPVPVLLYPLAWWPTLVLLDAVVRARAGRSFFFDDPARALSLAIWSVPWWLLFEAINLRLENWYYVDTPRSIALGRVMLVTSFATVIPAVLVCASLAATLLPAAPSLRPVRPTRRLLVVLSAAGWLCLAFPLVWPDLFYPLVWIFPALLLEPHLHRIGAPSFLDDLARGDARRMAHLLVGGLFAGLLWESLNVFARCRWIYTVPFFERSFFVEMPPLGFLGFLPFALSTDSFVRALEAHGLSPAPRGRRAEAPLPGWVRFLALPPAVAVASFACVLALEERTVDSRDPKIADLPGVDPSVAAILETEGLGLVARFVRAADEPHERAALAERLGLERRELEKVFRIARLADLRGIGAENAALLLRAGIGSVEALARADPEDLCRRLTEAAGRRIVCRRVRVWVRAARALVSS